MSRIDSLHGMVAFVATVETGSFAAAGRKLGLSASAIGKAVGRLEARLSVKLLQRTTRSIALTGEGETLYIQSSRVLDGLREAEATISRGHSTPSGRLKVSVPTGIGRRLIVPALPRFLEMYPDIEMELWLDDRNVEIVEQGYDLVLRMGQLEDSSLIARRVGPHRFITCGAPDYLASRGIPDSPTNLADHACVRFRFPSTGRLEQWAFKTYDALALGKGLVLNDSEALAAAARAGLGIIQAPWYLVEDDVSSGRLHEVLASYATNRGDMWFVWPSSRHELPRLRVFVDFFTSMLSADQPRTGPKRKEQRRKTNG
jgi:DNA-binding transcriptional LysR family regulator